MRKIIKYSTIILMLFIFFLFKDYVYRVFGMLSVDFNNVQINIEKEILKAENNNLIEELNNINAVNNLKEITNFDYVIAKVNIRNPYTFFDTLIINKGSDDGITKGDAVVNENGLIGLIGEVSKNSSKVNLITGSSNEISIIVHGFYGILSSYSKENNSLIIKNLNNYDHIEKNDYVYTSGLGSLPGGILVGKVFEIDYDHFEIEKSIYVESKIDFTNLFYVGVIKSTKEDES